MAKAARKVPCPRCEGTGYYAGFGVCYRCRGRKVVTPTKARKGKGFARPLTHEELAAKVGKATADAAFAYTWEE